MEVVYAPCLRKFYGEGEADSFNCCASLDYKASPLVLDFFDRWDIKLAGLLCD